MKTRRSPNIKFHCDLSCHTLMYWFPSLDTRYIQQLLLIDECKVCGEIFYHWAGIFPNGTQDCLHSIKPVDLPVWLARLSGAQQQSRFGPMVSEYTELLGQDTAHTYHRILTRQHFAELGGLALSQVSGRVGSGLCHRP